MVSRTAAQKTVDSYVAELPSPQKEVVAALRQLIRKAAPGLKETIKWGMPCYVGTENVCSIMAYKSHVNFAIFRGAELSDKNGLLEGTGKGMRHVTIRSVKDIRKGAIVALVKQANNLE
jgi:hypothetical protein